MYIRWNRTEILLLSLQSWLILPSILYAGSQQVLLVVNVTKEAREDNKPVRQGYLIKL